MMPFTKPFHRNVRKLKAGPNSGYSSWAYIAAPEYANVPTHYIRAYQIIQSDLEKLFEYIEPSDESLKAYSYRIHELLMRTCIEVEANFKAILTENIYVPANPNPSAAYNMSIYSVVEKTHHLSSYEVSLPIWNGLGGTWRPFDSWRTEKSSPSWYKAYNACKHDRQEEFKQANIGHLIEAVAGLLVLLSSQFKTQDFSSGPISLALGDEGPFEPAIGSLFRIKFPDDWSDEELYDFNWSELKDDSQRFNKIDYNLLLK